MAKAVPRPICGRCGGKGIESVRKLETYRDYLDRKHTRTVTLHGTCSGCGGKGKL